jgi:hypothetical protein
MRRVRPFALAGAALLLGAAAAAAAAPAVMGAFTATVSGGVIAQLRGSAIFQDVVVTGDSAASLSWVSLAAGGDPDHRIQLSRKALGAPAVGSYRITDAGAAGEGSAERAPDEFGAMYERPAGEGAGSFGADSGTVVITSSTATRVSGRFSFTATADDGGRTIAVSGRFTADRAAERRK